MEKGIKRCQVHNEASDTFCETCKRISCPMCEECEKHKTMSIDKFIKKNKAHLKPTCFKKYKDTAKKASETLTETITHNDEKISVLEEKARDLQETITNSEEGRTRDLNLITEATQHMRGVQINAFTKTLKEATEEAIHILDVSDKIEAEISKYKPELERQKTKLLNMKQRSRELTWKVEWLDTITRSVGDKLDEEVKLATSLCVVNDVIDQSGASPIILGYKAFPSICEVFDFKKVMKQEFVDVGNDVKASKPINVSRELKSGTDVPSSLSHNGVLAICCNCYLADKLVSEYGIQMTDLVEGKKCQIKMENMTHTGFYDDSMVVLTNKRPLRVCPVEEMFSKKNVSALRKIGDVKVYPFAEVTLFHSTRVLVFTSTSCIPYELNVDTGIIRKLDIGKRIYSFASLTGVDVGVKGVFIERGNKDFTYLLNDDNSTALVSKCNHGWCFHTFIPSSSDPRDIKKGMEIYYDGSFFTYTTERAYLITPFKYQSCQSIVRLYQDIFLVYDGNTRKWCLVKITVP